MTDRVKPCIACDCAECEATDMCAVGYEIGRDLAHHMTNRRPDPTPQEQIEQLKADMVGLREQLADLRHSMGALFVQMGVGEHED